MKKLIMARNGEFSTVITIIIILSIAAALAVPNFRKGGDPNRRQKACYANIRVLLGAVEMYNMDVPGMSMMKDLDMQQLVKTGYIKNVIYCPRETTSETYKTTGDLTLTGKIYCTLDGSTDHRDVDLSKMKPAERRMIEGTLASSDLSSRAVFPWPAFPWRAMLALLLTAGLCFFILYRDLQE